MSTPAGRAVAALIDGYEAVLLDAYGVLVDAGGARPGACELLSILQRRKLPWFVLTNGASRLPETAARRWAGMGLDISPQQVITSAELLRPYWREHALAGKPCAVLGPEDSARYVERAGGRVVAASEDFEVLVLADETGYPFLETIDAALTTLYARIERGAPIRLVLPNPDLVYPTGPGRFGVTAGAIAVMIEAALVPRAGDDAPRFAPLGKPQPAMFEEALRRAGTRNALMVGDQLATDIRGARNAGIDSVLVAGGVSLGEIDPEEAPTYVAGALV